MLKDAPNAGRRWIGVDKMALLEVKEQCKKCFHFQVCANVLKQQLLIREKMLNEEDPKCEHFISSAIEEVFEKYEQQKAEIEKLKNDCFCIANERDAMKDVIDSAVTEAIEDFSKRLKSLVHHTVFSSVYGVMLSISENDFDNLLKEMGVN
jgi:hypothetical protein